LTKSLKKPQVALATSYLNTSPGFLMSKTVSPLAPKSVPTLPALEGVRIATAEAGIRYKNRTDVLYVTLPKDTTVAGVFTRSKCPSAPVDWCRKNLAKGHSTGAGGELGQCQRLHGQEGR
jgi:glutamate N-acetyltransferase / amino-acid N-acetyltransferase